MLRDILFQQQARGEQSQYSDFFNGSVPGFAYG